MESDRPRAVPKFSCEVNLADGATMKHHAGGTTIELPAGASSNRRSENAVWAYPLPYDEVSGLAGHYAFYPNRVDSITAT